MAQKKAAPVIPFPTRAPEMEEEEVEVGLPPAFAPARQRSAPASAIDLTDRPKVWFAIGPGRSGKTTLLRWIAEEIAATETPAIYAAADPQNRSLKSYIDGVAEPPTNDAAAVTRWLEQLLQFIAKEKTSALIDLGGGDTSLGRLVAQMPDLASTIEDSGISPIAMYLLGPRIDDLASLATFEAAGFQPKATALVLNEGLADPVVLADPSSPDPFARITRHSAYRAALERGAIELRMPRLDPEVASEIEAKRLRFAYARDGVVPEGRRVSPVAPFSRSRVRQWLAGMSTEFAPVRSWLP